MNRQIAYIAGPYRSHTNRTRFLNIQNAIECAEYMRKQGYACIVPHLESLYHEDCMSEEKWIEHGLKLLSVCDMIVLVQGYQYSQGTKQEVQFAIENKIPIYEYYEKEFKKINAYRILEA